MQLFSIFGKLAYLLPSSVNNYKTFLLNPNSRSMKMLIERTTYGHFKFFHDVKLKIKTLIYNPYLKYPWRWSNTHACFILQLYHLPNFEDSRQNNEIYKPTRACILSYKFSNNKIKEKMRMIQFCEEGLSPFVCDHWRAHGGIHWLPSISINLFHMMAKVSTVDCILLPSSWEHRFFQYSIMQFLRLY